MHPNVVSVVGAGHAFRHRSSLLGVPRRSQRWTGLERVWGCSGGGMSYLAGSEFFLHSAAWNGFYM